MIKVLNYASLYGLIRSKGITFLANFTMSSCATYYYDIELVKMLSSYSNYELFGISIQFFILTPKFKCVVYLYKFS